MCAIHSYKNDLREATHFAFDASKCRVQIWIKNKHQNIEMIEYQLKTAEKVKQFIQLILQNTNAIFQCLATRMAYLNKDLVIHFPTEELSQDFENIVSILCRKITTKKIGASLVLSSRKFEDIDRAFCLLDHRSGHFLKKLLLPPQPLPPADPPARKTGGLFGSELDYAGKRNFVFTLFSELQMDNGEPIPLSEEQSDWLQRWFETVYWDWDEFVKRFWPVPPLSPRPATPEPAEENICVMDRELPLPRAYQDFPSSFCTTTVIKWDGTRERFPYPS